MNRTRSAWLSVALLCGALLVGCGSSSSTTTSTASSTAPATTQSTPASTSTSTPSATSTATTPTSSPLSASSPAAQASRLAAAICNKHAARQKLKPPLKGQVEAICHDYETGNTAKVREDAEKACTEAIEQIPGDSAAKKQALARCKSK